MNADQAVRIFQQVAGILKDRFPNLTIADTNVLTRKIVLVVDEELKQP